MCWSCAASLVEVYNWRRGPFNDLALVGDTSDRSDTIRGPIYPTWVVLVGFIKRAHSDSSVSCQLHSRFFVLNLELPCII